MIKFTLLTVVFAISICSAWSEQRLVVHEWGTFTSLQDEQGRAIGGINTDDEPVPSFVHQLSGNLLLPADRSTPVSSGYVVQGKGLTPRCHPDVIMRLETPVLYFYPPVGWKPQPVDVRVGFPGGWLTEFYPEAVSTAPGFINGNIGHIKNSTAGELSWTQLQIGAEGAGPETSAKPHR